MLDNNLINAAIGHVILDSRKKREKIDRYNDLKYEVQILWECNRVKIMPVIIGALWMVHSRSRGMAGKDWYQERFHHTTESLFAGDSQDLEIYVIERLMLTLSFPRGSPLKSKIVRC